MVAECLVRGVSCDLDDGRFHFGSGGNELNVNSYFVPNRSGLGRQVEKGSGAFSGQGPMTPPTVPILQPVPPMKPPTPIRPHSVCVADGPNLKCTLYRLLGERSPRKETEFLNLATVRQQFMQRFGLHVFEWYERTKVKSDISDFQLRVECAGWTYRSVSRVRWGLDNNDPVDDEIQHRIAGVAAKQSEKKAVIALLSHDGGYEKVLWQHILAGGDVALVGFTGCFSRKLYEMTDFTTDAGHRPVQLIDLEYDLRAVEIPARCSSWLPTPQTQAPASDFLASRQN